MTPPRRRSAALLVLLAMTACAPAVAVAPGPEAMVIERLFFGRSIPGGGVVAEEDWRTFVREVVTPRFPDGFTVLRGEGQWLGADGTLAREDVVVVEIVRPAGAAGDAAVVEIAEEYKRRFRQEAVLRITVPVQARFLE